MQPYFFPYVGYFALISSVDRWVVFDEAQSIRRGWMQRNRILAPGGGWQWIGVPLAKHPRDTPIKHVRIGEVEKWRERVIGQLDVYRRAPHYSSTVDIVQACIRSPVEHVSDLNVIGLGLVCDALDVPFRPTRMSEIGFDASNVHGPADWALELCRQVGATTYVNPIGGVEIYQHDTFEAAGIELQFLNARPHPYDQERAEFEPWLSIIDVLMWNDPAEVRAMLSDVELS